MMLRLVFFLLSAVLLLADPPLSRLQSELDRLSSLTFDTAGVAIIHLESGQSVEIRGEQRFPLASAVKVAFALEFLKRVEEGKDSLDRMVEFRPSDVHPGSGMLIEYFPKGGLSMTMRNYVELMLLDSDNSATDVVLREVGGPKAVMARLKQWGIEDFDVSRNILQLLADLAGVKGIAMDETFSLKQYEAKQNELTSDARLAASRAFYADNRDTASPRAMALLLSKTFRGELLNAENTRIILDMMERCRTGENRLKGILPKNTVVAHKTGTFSLVSNDVGIITLPSNAGHLAIAAFTKGTASPEKARIIAELARAAHDFFLFQAR